jgi:hypothetical protein
MLPSLGRRFVAPPPSGHAVRMAAEGELRVRDQATGAGVTCRAILHTLPDWFGLPASVEDYVATADRSPTVIASLGDEDVGLLTLVRHSEYAAEVYVWPFCPNITAEASVGPCSGMLKRDWPPTAWNFSR